jgi:hypothetical protein
MLLSGLTPMDKYLPHSTLADMNATHLDIERIRIAAKLLSEDMFQTAHRLQCVADELEEHGCLLENEYQMMLHACATLRQLAEGK